MAVRRKCAEISAKNLPKKQVEPVGKLLPQFSDLVSIPPWPYEFIREKRGRETDKSRANPVTLLRGRILVGTPKRADEIPVSIGPINAVLLAK